MLLSSSSNNNYHHGDLKEALLQAAKRLIVEKGIDALSLRSIAAEVGVSHMAPYAHFKNKSELFQSLAALGFVELSTKLQKIQQVTKNSNELILLYGVAYIEFATAHPELYKLMLNQTHSDLKAKTTSNSSLKKGQETETEIILKQASKRPYMLLRQGFAINESDEDTLNIQAQGAWALVHGISSLLITGQLVIDKNLSIKEFLATASKGLSHQ
jgi:AcrR family transcriptional regulator